MRPPQSLASRLKDQITIQRPVADSSLDGAGSGTWQNVATVWAEVQDQLPSRGETLAAGMTTMVRPARVRMRFRDDITGSMRFVMGDRKMSIISGPAVFGRREGLEFVVAEYMPGGNQA